MQPLDYIKLCLTQKYADFNGRARRSEFWYFFLFNFIVNIIGEIIDAALGNQIIGIVLGLAILVPGIAVAVRRMHDVGKSGWFVLIPIYNIILACTDSQPGSNEYGPNPKTGGSDVTDHLV